MAWVYILRSARRHYIGATDNLQRRIAEHKRGSNHTTHRFGTQVELVVAKQVPSMAEARRLEKTLKRKKESATGNFNPAVRHLIEQPRNPSALVPGSSPGRPKR
jgi:predicted GIY-YIG superfamily endonuclease